jgi:hypothetical protein
MERTMRSIKLELKTENAEKTEDDIALHAGAVVSAGPGQIHMTDPSLAPPKPQRWVAHRKAEVVAAVRGGVLSLSEACQRYALSVEEYLSWEHEIDLSGLPGLRMNRTQQRRRTGQKAADR